MKHTRSVEVRQHNRTPRHKLTDMKCPIREACLGKHIGQCKRLLMGIDLEVPGGRSNSLLKLNGNYRPKNGFHLHEIAHILGSAT